MTRGSGLQLIEPRRAPGAAFTPVELPRIQQALETAGGELFELEQSGKALERRSVAARLTDEQELELTLVYAVPAAGALRIRATHLQRLTRDHASAITLIQDYPPAVLGSAVLTQEAPEWEAVVLAVGDAPRAPPPMSFVRMFGLGLEHILTGYDHLLFLAALLVASRRWRSVVAIVTSFTLAHSLTLAASWLGLLSPPASLIEPLILASIVFIGVENLVRKGEPPARSLVSFAFGLIHGFGFAGALRELGLGADATGVLLPLLGFNLGVEAGQLAVIVLLLPLICWLRRQAGWARHALPAVSAIVTLAGGYWLVSGALGSGP